MSSFPSGYPAGTWSAYDDGIVVGRLQRSVRSCDVCCKPTACIEVASYRVLREWRSTIIWINRGDQELAVFLGVGCGCMARFHRQVAHIRDKQKKVEAYPSSSNPRDDYVRGTFG